MLSSKSYYNRTAHATENSKIQLIRRKVGIADDGMSAGTEKFQLTE
mgnify:CR=1 FL=1